MLVLAPHHREFQAPDGGMATPPGDTQRTADQSIEVASKPHGLMSQAVQCYDGSHNRREDTVVFDNRQVVSSVHHDRPGCLAGIEADLVIVDDTYIDDE